MHANAQKTDTVTGEKPGLLSFPGGAAEPHEVRRWQRSLQSTLVIEKLTDVASGKLPAGKFGVLWSKASLAAPPAPPTQPTWSEELKYRSFVDEVEKRKRFNKAVKEESAAYFRDENNRYFTIITDSMVRTNPSMRDTLRERYQRRHHPHGLRS